jgi:hypothetical protein
MDKEHDINPSDDTPGCEVCEGFAGEIINKDEARAGHISFTTKMESLLNHHLPKIEYDQDGKPN